MSDVLLYPNTNDFELPLIPKLVIISNIPKKLVYDDGLLVCGM